MDRSKAPKQRLAADTAASVQAFAGSILNKHRPGRGRDKYGSAPMLHAKPKGESAGVQQRIHIHVTPPRAAEAKSKRKTEEPRTVRIIEREKVRVEHKTIVVREIVRIMDNQRTARALAMTAPVHLEISPEHRQFPDAAAPLKKQEAGARRQDHYSGPQPAATTLVTSIHNETSKQETGKPIWQGQTLERLRRNAAAGKADPALAPLRRDHTRREEGGNAVAGAHIAAKKRPLTHVRREAVSAAAEQTVARAEEKVARTEIAAKRRATKAAEAEQAAERAEKQAGRAEAAAKRHATKAAESEQSAKRAEKQATLAEAAAKHRAAKAAESEQRADRAEQQAAREEGAAKHRSEKADEPEQKATREEKHAARPVQAAKRSVTKAIEAEQAADRAETQTGRTEVAAKRRLTKAAEAKQPTIRAARLASGSMKSNTGSRQAADLVHKKQSSDSADHSAAGGSDGKKQGVGSMRIPPSGELSGSTGGGGSAVPNPPTASSSSADRKPQSDSVNGAELRESSGTTGTAGATEGRLAEADVNGSTAASRRNAGRLLFYSSNWNAETSLVAVRKLQSRLTKQWLATRLQEQETGQPSSAEQSRLPIKARKLIYRQADGMRTSERPTSHPSQSSQSNRSMPAYTAPPSSDSVKGQRRATVQISGTTRPVHSALARPSTGSAAVPGMRPLAEGEAVGERETWRALSPIRNRRVDAGNDAGRRFPELLTARRRPASPETLAPPARMVAQPRPSSSPSKNRPAPTASSRHLPDNTRQENAGSDGVSTTGSAAIQRAPRKLGADAFSLNISRHAATPIVVRRATMRPVSSDHAGRREDDLPSGGRPAAQSLRRRVADNQSMEPRHPSGSMESYPPARLRTRLGALVLRRNPDRSFASQEGSSDNRRVPGTASPRVSRSANAVDAASTGVSRRNDSPRTSVDRDAASGSGRLSGETMPEASPLSKRRNVAATSSGAVLLNGLQPHNGSERRRAPGGAAVHKPLGLVLRRMPESLGARLVRLARSNRALSVAPQSTDAGNMPQRADGRAGTGSSTTSSPRAQRTFGRLIGRQQSPVIQAAMVDRAASSAASVNPEGRGSRSPASPQANGGTGQQPPTAANLPGLRAATKPVGGAALAGLQTAAQFGESRGAPVVAKEANGGSRRGTLVQRTAVNRNWQAPVGAKPGRGASQSTEVAQRAADIRRSPLIARPFAIAGQQSAIHSGGEGQSVDGSRWTGASSLAYSRRSTIDGAPHETAASQQPFSSAGAGAPGAAPLGLTHRTPPSAPVEPPRQVQVEAPREMEPEKLQRMIMKMPQLNPEAIADRVYKALERKMKLEQRRNGF